MGAGIVQGMWSAARLCGMERTIRIGTRKSRLSLWQARHVAGLITRLHPGARIDIREYSTRGDRFSTRPLAAIGGTGVFTSALEEALLAGEMDCAVHSLKDLPTVATPGLVVAAVPQRGDHRDALVGRNGETLDKLPLGARIGTGSPRRRAQLLALRGDLRIAGVRGNVPTRIDKLKRTDSDYDALVLSAAGLKRLDMDGHISQVFSEAEMLCAAGQGALAVQSRDKDAHLFAPLTHVPSALAVAAERGFLRGLQAGCSLPVGAHARVSGGRLILRGCVLSLDGQNRIELRREMRARSESPSIEEAARLGEAMAEAALERGAADLMEAGK